MSRKRRSRKNNAASNRQNTPVVTSRGSGTASSANRAMTTSGWWNFNTSTLPFFIIITVTFMAYANAWPNSLAMDDVAFAVSERFANLELAELAGFFTQDLWAASGVQSGLYRPFLLLSVAIDSYLFGDWVAGYHLINILLHGLATLCVYGFVRQLLLTTGNDLVLSTQAALLAAIIFGVHPIHTEAVNSIFNRSEILVTLGVTGGLWWFLCTHDERPAKAWLGITLIYLPVMLCRESGAALPALVGSMLWFTTPGNWWSKTRKCLPVLWMLIPLGIYIAMRSHALAVPALAAGTVAIDGAVAVQGAVAPVSKQALDAVDTRLVYESGRILPAAVMWFESLQFMLWPHPLQIIHGRTPPIWWLHVAPQLMLLVVAITAWVYKRPGLIIALAFFYFALLPSSRVIGHSGSVALLSERFLYLPSVGLAIFLAFGLVMLVKRFDLKIALVSVLALTFIFTPLTWARNAEWVSDRKLYESSYQYGARSRYVLAGLVDAYLGESENSRAVEICNRHIDEKRSRSLNFKCGVAYSRTGMYDDAERAYLGAFKSSEGASTVHYSLATLYMRMGRTADAKNRFEQAVSAEKYPFLKEYTTAQMLLELYPRDKARMLEARTHLERAIELQPQFYQGRHLLDQLNDFLNSR